MVCNNTKVLTGAGNYAGCKHIKQYTHVYGPISYWAIRAGLLTPLTFARLRLSPLAAFTSSAHFLHNGRR